MVNRMIVMASNYVGMKVVEFLVSRRERVDYLILDGRDKGGFNKKTKEIYQSTPNFGVVEESARLQEQGFLDQMANSNSQIGILAWWPYMLKGRVLTIPRKGWLNFHPAYLPYNRGKHPNFWCLVDGTPCGVSLHYIDSGVDTGDIVAREQLEVSWEDTGETLYNKLGDLIIGLFSEKYDEIMANRLSRMKQEKSLGSFHKASEIDQASTIDLNAVYTARKLLNIIRARMFPPNPTAVFYENGKKYSVQVIIQEIKDDKHE